MVDANRIDRRPVGLVGSYNKLYIALHIKTFPRITRLRPKNLWLRFPLHFSHSVWLLLLAICLCLPQRAISAVTLAELKAEPGLTPERFMRHFADFKFELGREVRPPETFLKNQSGDCDDFATLAADILRARGYTTRLVAVFMPHDVHVVCYVAEANSYLDYNCHQQASPLVKCDGKLAAIAASVAASFRAPWRSVSEFTFHQGARQFVSTEFR